MPQVEDTPEGFPVSSHPHFSAVLLANAKARSTSKNSDQFDETLAFLREQGWQVDLRFTKSADDARQLAREAVKQKADAVIAIGGDGTIHAVIQELAGSETALGVIPSGTFNVWANETGIPLDSAGARDVLVNGRTRRIDLGRVNDHYFLLMAGIGFGGTVTYAVQKQSLKRWGIFGYLLTGIRLGLAYDSFRTEVVIDGQVKRMRALQIVIGNTQLYGSMLKFTWRARCDDGLLDVCMVRSPAKLERIVVMLDFLLQRRQRRKWMSYHTCKSIEVRTRKPVNFQVDGEPVGQTPATFFIVPHVLKVIVPQETPEEVFSQQ